MQKTDLTKQFAQRLIEAMIEADFTSSRSTVGVDVSKLSDITGYSSVICRKYLKGEAIPDPLKLIDIAEALNVMPGWLLFGEQGGVKTVSPASLSISKTLLQYIFEHAEPLYQVDRPVKEVASFLVELVDDIREISSDESQSKKIIDLAISSITQFAR